ncbi:MAG: aspartate aminotransferase family protein [Verrucomicrobia bacterium]|nr:aspartate aminotransferase family protein [Verrucomicrobiota bacterium]MBV9998840.1 aspartate aminotransferase family protein [Verrucomicrobiota bacterium]
MEDTRQLFAQYVVPNYGRYDLVLVRGEGPRVWDENGKSYLDFGAGIAVSTLGHKHPRLLEAITTQAAQLIHTSNLYYTRPQGELARRLVNLIGLPGKVFFSNSGAEANEALIKVARKFGNECAGPGGDETPRYEIITFERSFHGRTMAGISATGQEKVKVGFGPLLAGFRHVPYNDLEAVREAITPQTAGVLVEVVQGEGGIHVATPEFLRGLRALCDEHHLLLMFDEIQCGLGRVGSWAAWRPVAPDVDPDAVSWAKGIGGGFPLGATWFRAKPLKRRGGSEIALCDLLQPGTHGTTFGGTPLACAASLAVLQTIEEEDLLGNVNRLGAYAVERLRRLDGIKEVRGFGLMLGLELDARFQRPETQPGGKMAAQRVVTRLMENGLLAVPAGPAVIRLLPPLNVRQDEMDQALDILGRTLREG